MGGELLLLLEGEGTKRGEKEVESGMESEVENHLYLT